MPLCANPLHAYIIPSSGHWKYLCILTLWHLVPLGSAQKTHRISLHVIEPVTFFFFFLILGPYEIVYHIIGPISSTFGCKGRCFFWNNSAKHSDLVAWSLKISYEIMWHCLGAGCDLRAESLCITASNENTTGKRGKAQTTDTVWIFSHTLPLFF